MTENAALLTGPEDRYEGFARPPSIEDDPELSIEMIRTHLIDGFAVMGRPLTTMAWGPSPHGSHARIVDVGGGSSLLVDRLLDAGFTDVTVLDGSPSALARMRLRLGARAAHVELVDGEVGAVSFSQPYDVWHDRAVFHVLTTELERQRYVRVLKAALRPGGLLIVTTFAHDAPSECDGVPVGCYSPRALEMALGGAVELIECRCCSRNAPRGAEQELICCAFRRREDGASSAK